MGETLGLANNAMYLREPVSQSDATVFRLGTVIDLIGPEVEQTYCRLADKAFLGWPDFGRHIVQFPFQWRLLRRRRRRVVIKEVNPLATGWYKQRYQPCIVFLVRHPVAVAVSWRKQGWLGSSVDDWAKNGTHQGRALREACDALAQYSPHCMVRYEALCADPLREFERLFAFAGLRWDHRIRARILRTSQGEWADAVHTSRLSASMIDAWRSDVEEECSTALKDAYRRFDLPWYRDDRTW